MKKRAALLSVACLLLLCGASVQAQVPVLGELTVPTINGIHPDGLGLYCGDTVEFVLAFENTSDMTIAAFEFPLSLDPDGDGSVDIIAVEWINEAQWEAWFSLSYVVNLYTLGDVDSFYVAGQRLTSGMPPGAASELVRYRGVVNCDAVGQTVCFDTSHVRPGCLTCPISVVANGQLYHPAWDGPHCFAVRPCCYGQRGDINQDGSIADPVDIVFLVNYMFHGGPPPVCDAATDWNADGSVGDAADLAAHVDYHYAGGDPPPPCP